MKNHCSAFTFVALAAGLMVAAKAAVPPDTQPPVLHLPAMALHDPFILADAVSHTYFLYTSNQHDMSGDSRAGVMAYSSKDLRNWSRPVVVFSVPEHIWADSTRTPWAPEVHAYRGKLYLFTTLHNQNKILRQPPNVPVTTYMRGTCIAVSDSPTGPFTLLKTDGPIPPADFMTLDGTFYQDPDGKPWMVYAHEWLQKTDGTMEAIPLQPDLSAAAGPPIHLFKGSDAPWLNDHVIPSTQPATSYVTDGPELFRTHDGHLLMLWSSYDRGSYVETVARSKTGTLQGPWEQLPPLVQSDSGHGMLFTTFDGQLMLVLHRPFRNARGKIYEMKDAGDHLDILRERTDLDTAP
jgi:beta-xylosidase